MPRRPLPRQTARLAGCLLGAAALVSTTSCGYLSERLGLDGDPPATPSPSATASSSPRPPGADGLAALVASAEPARVDICRVVPDGVVRGTLDLERGSSVPEPDPTLPGDTVDVRVDGRVQQVPVAEFACTWSPPGGLTEDQAPGQRSAFVRVFAPSFDTDLAAALVRAAESEPGCTPVDGLPAPGAAGLGSPGTALACGTDTLRYEGLVGDAYVVCGLTRADLTAQLGPAVLGPRLTSWCTQTLSLLDTSQG